jgi:hypothetical protein
MRVALAHEWAEFNSTALTPSGRHTDAILATLRSGQLIGQAREIVVEQAIRAARGDDPQCTNQADIIRIQEELTLQGIDWR